MKKTRNIFIFSILFLLLSILVYGTLFFMIRVETMKVSGLRDDIDLVLRQEQQLKSSQYIIADTEELRDELNSYFIHKNGVVDFLEKIERFGDDSSVLVEVTSVDIEPILISTEIESKIVDNLNIVALVEGEWRDVFYFLNLIESQPLHVSVEQINIENRDGDWTMNIDFNALKLK